MKKRRKEENKKKWGRTKLNTNLLNQRKIVKRYKHIGENQTIIYAKEINFSLKKEFQKCYAIQGYNKFVSNDTQINKDGLRISYQYSN